MPDKKEEEQKDFGFTLTVLSEKAESLIRAQKVSSKPIKQVIGKHVSELTAAASIIMDGLDVPTELDEEPTETTKRKRVVSSKGFDIAIKGVPARRLKEIEGQLQSIPDAVKSGELNIPEVKDGTPVFLVGRANEVYVKVEGGGDDDGS